MSNAASIGIRLASAGRDEWALSDRHMNHRDAAGHSAIRYDHHLRACSGEIPIRGKIMKRVLAVSALAVSFIAGVALSAQVHDWHDLDKCHQHVIESIHEMERARAANHYDMDGHGVKAEEHLRAAEHELDMAVQAARR
jgi:hypothetical protein